MTAFRAPAGYYPAAGLRDGTNGGPYWFGQRAYAYSSTAAGLYQLTFFSDATTVIPAQVNQVRVYGRPVRCLQAFALAIFWENGTRNTENAFCQRIFPVLI